MAAHNIPVRAVCDDFRTGEKLDGYPILRMEDAPIAPQTVIFITSGFNAKMKDYIRHYSPTIIETVLYAVPKEREAMRHAD